MPPDSRNHDEYVALDRLCAQLENTRKHKIVVRVLSCTVPTLNWTADAKCEKESNNIGSGWMLRQYIFSLTATIECHSLACLLAFGSCALSFSVCVCLFAVWYYAVYIHSWYCATVKCTTYHARITVVDGELRTVCLCFVRLVCLVYDRYATQSVSTTEPTQSMLHGVALVQRHSHTLGGVCI